MKNKILLHLIYIIILLGAFSILYRWIYEKAELKHIKNQNVQIKNQNIQIIVKLDAIKEKLDKWLILTIE